MAYQYITPDFLKNQSVNEIHQRMMNNLPDDIDKSELQLPWDFTRPSAIEKSELVEFELNETIQIMFVQSAYGEWLDAHAVANGLSRRAANKASGEVTVTAVAGTVVSEGFQFATPAGLSSSVIFEATEEVIFDGKPNENGYVVKKVKIRAIDGGIVGNVPADSIKLMTKPLGGIVLVKNEHAISGGSAAEDDDTLRERILEAFQYGISFAGNNADYMRWAKEVSAVGSVIVEPEWNDPNMPDEFHYTDKAGKKRCAGAVRLIVTDVNGDPANTQILEEVYNHIVSPDDELERLAPIGATVTVTAPVAVKIKISARVTLDEGENLSAVKKRFEENLKSYWVQAADDGWVKYVYIGSVLAKTSGVVNYDYDTLEINGEKKDIPISIGEFPTTGEVDLNGGT